jgi:hypothetical protein
VPFPSRIRVDVTSVAWEFGAYTVGEGDSAHAVIASTVAGTQGFGSLESLMHEPSHAVVGADTGAIGADLSKVAQELGVKPRYNLWHAILFYTSGELTRRALARRGVTSDQPFILGMYDRGFRGFREALETHWQAYLDGKDLPRRGDPADPALDRSGEGSERGGRLSRHRFRIGLEEVRKAAGIAGPGGSPWNSASKKRCRSSGGLRRL